MIYFGSDSYFGKVLLPVPVPVPDTDFLTQLLNTKIYTKSWPFNARNCMSWPFNARNCIVAQKVSLLFLIC
jgi:hypothetical protein